MHYEYIGALEVTYGHALAGGGGFRRVTTQEGNAAELTPATYLWFKSTSTSSTSAVVAAAEKMTTLPMAIVHLHIGGETPAEFPVEAPPKGKWIRMEKPIDRLRGLYVWYLAIHWRGPNQKTKEKDQEAVEGDPLRPLKEIRVVRDVKDLPEGFCCVESPPLVSETTDAAGKTHELRSYVCFKRLDDEDLSGSAWTLATQRVGVWIDVRDLASNRWRVGQVVNVSASECRISVATWSKKSAATYREEVVPFAMSRSRAAPLGTHTALYLSPSYPMCRKQGASWNLTLRDLEGARAEFDQQFFTSDHAVLLQYLKQRLTPLVEKSMLSLLLSTELAEQVNVFHQHVVKNIVAWFVDRNLSSSDARNQNNSVAVDAGERTGSRSRSATTVDEDPSEAVIQWLLSILRLVLSGMTAPAAGMFFYLKYGGPNATKAPQNLVYTSYLAGSEALASVPTRHPCRSSLFVDMVDVFLQVGGFKLILERVGRREVTLVEVAVLSMILLSMKPCLTLPQKRKRTSSSSLAAATGRRKSSPLTENQQQVEDFFREFLQASLARLRRMQGDELRDEDGLVEHIIAVLDAVYRDGALLGSDESFTSSGPGNLAMTAEGSANDNSSSSSTSVSTEFVAAEVFEMFHLDLAKKYICCPFLAQRLLGVARLNDMIAMAQRRDALQKKSSFNLKRTAAGAAAAAAASSLSLVSSLTGSSSSLSSLSETNSVSTTKWLRYKFILEWLLDSEVIEVILGQKEACAKYGIREGVHLELLKRSRSILEAVTQAGLLTETHVLLIWKAAMSQLRTGRKTLLELLVALCNDLTADMLDIVMVLLTQVAIADYDELLLQFIQKLVEIASKNALEAESGAKKSSITSFVGAHSKRTQNAQKEAEVMSKIVTLGLSLMWNAIEHKSLDDQLAESASSATFTMQVAVAFAESLNQVHRVWSSTTSNLASAKELQQLLSQYVTKCVGIIKAGGQSTEMALTIVQKVVENYGRSASSSASSASSTLAMARSTFQGSAGATSNPSDLVKELQSKHSLITLIVDDIERSVQGARGCTFSETASDFAVRLSGLEKRLAFLSFIVKSSELELVYKHVERLWQSFNPRTDQSHNGARTNEDNIRDVFFNWLSSIIADPKDYVQRAYAGKHALSPATTEELFVDLTRKTTISSTPQVIQLDISRMTTSSFAAFERLFQFVNVSNRKLSCEASSTNGPSKAASVGQITVDSMDMKGLETLFDIALRARRDVSDAAVNYLVHLHLRLGSKLVKREVWTEFARGCVSRLVKAKGEEAEASSQRDEVCRRLLVLLNTLLFQSSQETSPSASDSSNAVESLTVYVRTQDGRAAAPFYFTLKRTFLVGELRDLVARDSDHPADRVRLINDLKIKLTAQGHDRLTLEKAQVLRPGIHMPSASSRAIVAAPSTPEKRKNYVEAVLLNRPDSDTVGHIQRSVLVGSENGASSEMNDWDAVKFELSSSKILRTLQQFLSLPVGVSEEAWKLLKQLNYDSAMEKKLRTLDDALNIDGSIRKNAETPLAWTKLLDVTCPPKLLYQLELLEKFAVNVPVAASPSASRVPERKRSEASEAVNAWSESFVALGGLTHLKTFVLTMNVQELVTAGGSLALMCVARVFQLLYHFVIVNQSVQQGLETRPDLRPLVVQVVQMIQCMHALEKNVPSVANANSRRRSKSVKEERDSIPIYARPGLDVADKLKGLSESSSDELVTVSALKLLAASVIAHEESSTERAGAVELLQSIPDSGSLLLACLVRSSNAAIRKEALYTMSDLCSPTKNKRGNWLECRKFFLNLIANCEDPTEYSEYYELYSRLIQGQVDRGAESHEVDDLAWFDFLAACVKLCRRIVEFPAASTSAQPAPNAVVKMAASPLKHKKKEAPPDAVYELSLSTLLAVLKKIPPVLAETLDSADEESRSLREVVVATINTQEGIVQELFTHGLFPADAISSSLEKNDDDDKRSAQYYLTQPKCKSDSCRQTAFELLRELAVESVDGLRYLFVQMAGHHSLVPPQDPSVKQVTAPQSAKKKQRSSVVKALGYQGLERGKYVGLKNLGCTCYMNSTIQAFFMIPRFRRQILRYASRPDGLVYQLQSVFGHLEGSAKAYYNPKALTMAMKTWDGEPIDVNEQQDASEFLTSFFQQIESEMNGRVETADPSDAITTAVRGARGDESILNSFFGGVFSNELVAEGDRYSERFEPFHFISVPVRDRKNLLESLDGWAEGDKVSYTWESAATEEGGEPEKVTLDTHKRISIQKLPDQLIIHLKRFEFDFEAMQQTKIHDRFEFPTELDMYPYTKEGQAELRSRKRSHSRPGTGRKSGAVNIIESSRPRAPEYYEYELVGTVVHMGSAHSGHYYSFLRDHDSGKQSSNGDSQQHQWYEFNDTHVSPFDAANIPEECFGGQGDGDDEETAAMRRRKKTRSSFMLFYSRRQPKVEIQAIPVSVPAAAKSVSVYGLALTFIIRLKIRARGRLEYLRSRSHVLAPEPIQEQILLENRMFWRKKYLFNRQYLDFTFQLMSACMAEPTADGTIIYEGPIDIRSEALQLATKFVFGTLWQSGDITAVLKWKQALCALYREEVRGSQWLLTTLRDNDALLLELLVCNEHAEVRELMAIVLEEAIMTTSHTAAAMIAQSHRAASPGSSPGKSSRRRRSSTTSLPPSFEFMFLLFRLMPWLLTVPVRQHQQYFEVLLSFTLSGQNECTFAVVNSVAGAIVSLLTGLGSTQPLLRGELERVKGRTILKRLELDYVVLKLLSLLLRSVPPPDMDVQGHQLLPPSMASNANAPSLPAGDHEAVLSDRFVTLLTQQATHYTRSTKPLEQIVIHLSWQSRRMTAKFSDAITHGIETQDHDEVKPYFRTFNTMLKIKDSLAQERLDDGMTKIVAVMASQQRFYKATEVAMDMFTRLAKRHARVEQWVRQHQSSCVWMDKWLRGHRGIEGYLQQGRTSLVKQNSTSSWGSVSVQSESLVRSLDRTISKLYPRIHALLDPSKAFETFYDSDDNPMRLVGKRVRVKWAKEKWYEGLVERFDERSYEHLVEYDDGDKRQYRMSDKIFYIVEPPPSTGDEAGSSSPGRPASRRRESSSADL